MSRPVRLLSIVTRMNVGGPAVQISNLMQGLFSTNVYQVLMTGRVGDDEEDFLTSRELNLRTRIVPDLQREISPQRDLRALADIARFMREFKPDIVHTHTAKAGALGRLASQVTRSRAKRVHTFHGHLLHGYFSPLRTKAVIKAEQVLARHTDLLIAVGENVRDELLAEDIGTFSKYRIVPPGLALGPRMDMNEARVELGIPSGSRVVCFIGRLTPIKRIDRLVDVIRILRPRYPDLVFVIAGDGSEFDFLRKAAEDEQLPIRALGWRSDVERIMSASDVMLLTSDNEGTPVALIQAGLFGLPSVSTRVGSVPDVVIDGETGLLAERDAAELASAVARLLDDKDLRISMAEASSHHYSKKYSAATLTRNHLEVYRELLEASSNAQDQKPHLL